MLDIVTYLLTTVLEFTAVLLFFGPFPTLLGWHVGEVVLLTAIMSISFGFAEMIGAGIDNFAETIRRGDFDRVLLRPVGVFTQVIGSDFRLRRLGRLTQGALAFILAVQLLPHLHWTVVKVLVLVLGVVSGAIIFITILLLGATVCFWTIETTELTNILTYGGREMLSYPLTIYHQILQRFSYSSSLSLLVGMCRPAIFLSVHCLLVYPMDWLSQVPWLLLSSRVLLLLYGALECIAIRVRVVKNGICFCEVVYRIRRSFPHDDNDRSQRTE